MRLYVTYAQLMSRVLCLPRARRPILCPVLLPRPSRRRQTLRPWRPAPTRVRPVPPPPARIRPWRPAPIRWGRETPAPVALRLGVELGVEHVPVDARLAHARGDRAVARLR